MDLEEVLRTMVAVTLDWRPAVLAETARSSASRLISLPKGRFAVANDVKLTVELELGRASAR